MANQAKVTSLDALDAFRSSLIVFIAKAKRALDETSEEGHRMRQYLQNDQRQHWELQRRARTKKLEQAEAELLSARLAGHREAQQMRQGAVNHWKAAVEEAETKLAAIKQWAVHYDSTADPIFRRLEDFRQYVEADLPKAVALLVNVQKALEGYSEPGSPAPSGPSSATHFTTEDTEHTEGKTEGS
ncbi:MAG: hypothetical protein ACFUZC_01005 [Chthoniobacteraceae bacterium]